MWLIPRYFVSITAEVIIHNANLQTTLYYYQTIERENSGSFATSSDILGIFPEVYESFGDDSTTVMIIGAIYLVGLLLQLIKLVQNLMRTCTVL